MKGENGYASFAWDSEGLVPEPQGIQSWRYNNLQAAYHFSLRKNWFCVDECEFY